jgi:hypothetical protein
MLISAQYAKVFIIHFFTEKGAENLHAIKYIIAEIFKDNKQSE